MKTLTAILASGAILVFATSADDAAGAPARGSSSGTALTQPFVASDPLAGQRRFVAPLRGARVSGTEALLIELERLTPKPVTRAQRFAYGSCNAWLGRSLFCTRYLSDPW